VLSEKPLDITTKRADELIEACKAAGVKLGVFFQDRLRPAMVELKRLVDDGALGKLVMIAGRVRWYRPPEYYSSSKWRGTWALDGGGALMNQAIHTVDLVQWLYGPVSRVSATVATRVHDIEVEDTAAAVLDFTSGAIGTIEASTSLFPGYPRRLELTGSEGTVIVEGDTIVQRDLRGTTAAGEAAPPVRLENVASPVVSDASAHQRVLEDFIAAIREDRTPATDGLEARRSVELVETIYAAARKGRALAPGDV
jgi:predicted dehydrogenase